MSRLPADCWNQASIPRTLTLWPEGTKRSRLASGDTVKSFVFFTAADGENVSVFLRKPICYRSLRPCQTFVFEVPR